VLIQSLVLRKNETWDLVPLPTGKSVVGCRWVYAVKVHPDGTVDRLVKGSSSGKGLYPDMWYILFIINFHSCGKHSICQAFSFSVCHLSITNGLDQLDVKNSFLHGDFEEERSQC